MAKAFSYPVAQTFRQLGWTVASFTAQRREGDIKVQVWTDGKWTVSKHGDTVRRGQETNATYAALEANEIAWSLRRKAEWAERASALVEEIAQLENHASAWNHVEKGARKRA